jgi:hypothetical protein
MSPDSPRIIYHLNSFTDFALGSGSSDLHILHASFVILTYGTPK